MEIAIRCCFVLLAVAMGVMLKTPAEDVVKASVADDPIDGEDSVFFAWFMIVIVSGVMWAAVYLAVKGI